MSAGIVACGAGVVRAAGQFFRVATAYIYADIRYPYVVRARAAAVLAMRQVEGMSYNEIGSVLRRHHTTAMMLERNALQDKSAIAFAREQLREAWTPRRRRRA